MGDSDWIKFPDALAASLETAFQSVKSTSVGRGGRRGKVDPNAARVQVDNERFVDLSLTVQDHYCLP